MAGRRTTEGMATPIPKVTLLPAMISFHSKTLAMACANSTISMATNSTSAFSLVPGRKTVVLPNLYQFSSNPSTRHCHSHAFPSKCRPHFSHGQVE
jgi:hypothetical protein